MGGVTALALHGEGFLLFNWLTDGVLLLSAARFAGIPVRPVRLLAASLLGTLYALAVLLFPRADQLFALFAASLCMSAAAFPRGQIIRGVMSVWLIGLCGSGAAGTLLSLCQSDAAALLGTLAVMLSFCGMGKKAAAPLRGVVRIAYGGRQIHLPCLADTGNLLRAGGMPVAVAGKNMLGALQLHSERLPIVAAQTVSGRAELPWFRPDACTVCMGGKRQRVQVMIAVTQEDMAFVLLPACALQKNRVLKEAFHGKAMDGRRNPGVGDGAAERHERQHGWLYRRRGAAAPAADGGGGKGAGEPFAHG
ncbi:MAG: hypothetical protein E7326_07990 [Clostridiales bacterium]|nr:hypothetical protein [Clostridiales bacterium]